MEATLSHAQSGAPFVAQLLSVANLFRSNAPLGRVVPPDGGGLPHPQTRIGKPPSGQWNDDDYDVLANGEVVGRIFKANAAPVGSPWMWTLAFGHHEGRSPTHGYAATREAAMAPFAKSWRGNEA
jgi:hypothetical protein